MPTMLVVDDEQSICWGLTRLGESLGHRVIAASSAEQAFVESARCHPDVIILDVRLPGVDGLTAIARFQQQAAHVPIIIITAFGDLQIAVESIRRGAFDYIVKPFDVAKVKSAILRALACKSGQLESSAPFPESRVEGMVGRSPVMQEVYKQIALAASSDAAILLCGESGTGKELAARAIHRYSSRSNGPFIAVNVASLNSSQAESELFGHERGVLPEADFSRRGLLAQANEGTIFLDEVADIPQSTQVKLLRALEHGEVVPVGATSPISTDFRVISATCGDMSQHVAERAVRHDLLLRLCAFQIDLPPLRERSQDIAELASYFVGALAKPPGTPRVPITREALKELERRNWRGNVRELRNAIAYALIMARGRSIMPEHLPDEMPKIDAASQSAQIDEQVAMTIRGWAELNLDQSQPDGHLYDRLLDVVEPPLFEAAMKRHSGQCANAARTLGIHRTTLRKKLDAIENSQRRSAHD